MNKTWNPAQEYDFSRYLAAKKSIDDRSLNAFVHQSLRAALQDSNMLKPIQILELGAGIGTMIERLETWHLLNHMDYTAVDILPENMQKARSRLASWATSRGFQTEPSSVNSLSVTHPGGQLSIQFKTSDVSEMVQRTDVQARWDWIIAHAFMDLVDLRTMIPGIVRMLRHGGLLYLTLNFDGITQFLPTISPELDAQIEALYHQSMDQRIINGQPSGHSRTGRKLLALLPENGVDIVAAGPSDWIVHPTAGTYQDDDAYFLHYILETITAELQGHPELDQDQFTAWVLERHRQVELNQLVYLAHQIDVLGMVR